MVLSHHHGDHFHYGVFKSPQSDFRRAAAAAALPTDIHELERGETWSFRCGPYASRNSAEGLPAATCGHPRGMVGTQSLHNPTGRVAAEHPGLVKVGRVGWLAKGVVYMVAGLLAFLIALASRGWSTSGQKEASPTGALKEIATKGVGPLVLWVLAIGLFLYAAWRLVTAFLPGGHEAKDWAKRIGYVVSALMYGSFGLLAVRLAQGSGSSKNGNQQATDTTQKVMQHTGGRWLIGLIGVIVIAAGIYRLVKGVKVDVDDELDTSRMSPERRRWSERLGAIGEIGRGIAMALIGFFLLRAAWTFDPNQATGLDGALRRLAVTTWGALLVAVIGVGFMAYGLFCALTFPERRLQAP